MGNSTKMALTWELKICKITLSKPCFQVQGQVADSPSKGTSSTCCPSGSRSTSSKRIGMSIHTRMKVSLQYLRAGAGINITVDGEILHHLQP